MEQDFIKKENSKIAIMDRTFIILCCLMGALLLIRDVNGVNLPWWVFFILAIIVFSLYDMNYSAVFTCFLIPLIVGLPATYIFACGILLLMVKNWNQLLLYKYILFLIMIFTIELLGFIYGNISMINYIRFVAPILFISILIFNYNDNLDYVKMLYYFLFGAVVTELSIILQSISGNGLDSLISAGVRLGDTSELLLAEGMRISYNPNELGILCAISISIVLVFLSIDTPHKLILTALLVFQILVGSLSVSREFAVLLIIIVLIYLISASKSARGFFKGLAIITITTLMVYVSINYFSPSLIENFASRLAVEDLSAGRLDITAAYFDALAQHPERLFVGVGLQDYQKKSGLSNSSHNGTQEVIITWGVVGLVLVALYIFGIYKHGWRGVYQIDRKIIYLLPLMILLIGVQSVQFFSSNTPMYLLPAYATMRLAKSNRGINSETCE